MSARVCEPGEFNNSVMNRLEVCLWVGILVAALTGCNSAPLGPPVQESVTFFHAPKQAAAAAGDQLPEVRLYVDASESMKGYVAAGESSNYSVTIERLLERLAAAQYPLRAVQFSGGEKEIDKVSRLKSPEFYSGGDTPLSKIVGRMAEAVEAGHIAVLVSDMVQSDPLAERVDLVRALSKLSNTNGEILLIGCRSGFKGKYFVETHPKATISLNIADDPEAGRPFYLLIGAPFGSAMGKFKDKILTPVFEQRKVQMFAPSEQALAIGKDWKILGVGTAESVWSRKTQAALAEQTRGVLWESFTHKGGAAMEAPLRVELKAAVRSPLRDLSRLGYSIEKGTFKAVGKDGKHGPGEARERVERRPDCEIQGADKKWIKCSDAGRLATGEFPLRLTFPFTTPARNTWDVYRVKMTVGDGNLKPPEWITAWSTNSDRTVQDGTKTLYLEVLGESLVNGISENIVIVDRLIHLGRF